MILSKHLIRMELVSLLKWVWIKDAQLVRILRLESAVNMVVNLLLSNSDLNDPFEALDQNGVGQLVKMGVDKGRSTRPNLKIGICGEHGGEPSSVEFRSQ